MNGLTKQRGWVTLVAVAAVVAVVLAGLRLASAGSSSKMVGATRQFPAAHSPSRSSGSGASEWTLELATLEGWTGRLTVSEGKCGTFELTPQAWVEICPSRTPSWLAVRIVQHAGRSQEPVRHPMTLRLQPNVQVGVTDPFPFGIEWIAPEEPSPKRD